MVNIYSLSAGRTCGGARTAAAASRAANARGQSQVPTIRRTKDSYIHFNLREYALKVARIRLLAARAANFKGNAIIPGD
jgi:hypothetical protein